ncbi:MAG TPA: phosphoribosylformylglycinamidine cyclo-ligase [Candidatus Binataceae bacterium]|jgi:phosphoribosylformylglycinamidine cyclo-ligase|nr:phosphoribosylformylglycinamidine cyclo-ligase [Candidatus Binataceae bacterium]
MAVRSTYKAAGVDINLKESLVPLFRRLAARTSGANVLAGVGGFGALIGLDGYGMREPVLVAGTDSVGTKVKVAVMARRHDTVGIDCVAMCINDIICCGARPLFFLDYIGIGKLNRKIALDLVKGIAAGCAQAGASLVGGETAQMPGLYGEGEYDLVGFAVGIVDRDHVPDPRNLRAGDVLVGLASSGLHSNGFSLARQVLLERGGLKLSRRPPGLKSALGEELLRPTRIYAKIALELFRRFGLKALANITGGGVIENLPRVLPTSLAARIRRGSWPVPPIFDLIARMGDVSQSEMDRTFNNGIGMVAIFSPGDVESALDHLRRSRVPAYVIGELRDGARGVSLG